MTLDQLIKRLVDLRDNGPEQLKDCDVIVAITHSKTELSSGVELNSGLFTKVIECGIMFDEKCDVDESTGIRTLRNCVGISACKLDMKEF